MADKQSLQRGNPKCLLAAALTLNDSGREGNNERKKKKKKGKCLRWNGRERVKCTPPPVPGRQR